MRFVLISAALCLAGCATAPEPQASAPAVAAAAVPAGAAPAATKVAEVEKPKKICRRMMQTGSLQPQRICSTAEEWAEFDRIAKNGADRMNDMRRSGGITGDFDGARAGNTEAANRN